MSISSWLKKAHEAKKTVSLTLISDSTGNAKYIDECFKAVLNDKREEKYRMLKLRIQGYHLSDTSNTIAFMENTAVKHLW